MAKSASRFRVAFLSCGAAIAVASLLSSTWDTSTSVLTIYLVMLLFGIGTSCQSVCIQPYMQMSVSAADMGMATAMIQFANSVGVVIFNAFYNISYNMRYAHAMELGGGEHLAEAVAETFSSMSLLSAVTGLIIILFALRFTERRTSSVSVPSRL